MWHSKVVAFHSISLPLLDSWCSISIRWSIWQNLYAFSKRNSSFLFILFFLNALRACISILISTPTWWILIMVVYRINYHPDQRHQINNSCPMHAACCVKLRAYFSLSFSSLNFYVMAIIVPNYAQEWNGCVKVNGIHFSWQLCHNLTLTHTPHTWFKLAHERWILTTEGGVSLCLCVCDWLWCIMLWSSRQFSWRVNSRWPFLYMNFN